MITPGCVLYVSYDSPESVTEAREYIARFGLTKEQVKLIRVEGQIRVVALCNVNLTGQ